VQFRRGATHYHGRGGGAAGAKDSLLRSRSGPGQPSGQLGSGPRRSPGPCPRLRIGSPRAADGEEWPLRSINSPVLAPVATAMVSEKCRRSWKCTRDSPRAVRAFPMLAPALLADEGHHRVRCTGGHPGWTDLPVRVVDLLVGPKCFSVTAAGNRRLRLSVREDAHFIHAVQSLLRLAPGTLRVVIGVPAFPRLGSALPLTLLCHANRTQLSCGGTAGAGLILR
jgi:hypothetical protein